MRWFDFKEIGLGALALALGSLIATMLVTVGARAQEEGEDQVQACATAYEQAQVNRNSGKLVEAQQQLKVCVQEVCPDFVKADCGQWLSEIKRDMPSVIFSVVDSSGKELVDVALTVDGEAGKLDGLPMELNPGQHQVSYEYQGESFEEQIVVRQGEKNRVVKLKAEIDQDSDGDGVMDSVDACPKEAGVESERGCPAPPPPPPPPPGNEGLRMGAYVALGVGGAGLLTWGIFGYLGNSADQAARDECPTPNSCSPSRERELVDDVDGKFLIANIGLGVGIAGAVTGGVLYVLSIPGDEEKSGSKALNVAVQPTRDGGGLMSLSGSF